MRACNRCSLSECSCLLSLKDTTEYVFPLLKAGCVIKPVLVEHWKDIIFDDLSEPFVSTDITGAEIAVSYAEAFAKCLVICNLIIQFLDS